jgi:hypothetical protein
MRLDRLTEQNIAQLLDLALDKDALTKARDYLVKCKAARDDANAAVEAVNARSAEQDAREAGLATLDSSFDGQRAEIARLNAALDERAKQVEQREIGVRARETKIEKDTESIKARETEFATREQAATDALARAERIAADAKTTAAGAAADKAAQAEREAELSRVLARPR